MADLLLPTSAEWSQPTHAAEDVLSWLLEGSLDDSSFGSTLPVGTQGLAQWRVDGTGWDASKLMVQGQSGQVSSSFHNTITTGMPMKPEHMSSFGSSQLQTNSSSDTGIALASGDSSRSNSASVSLGAISGQPSGSQPPWQAFVDSIDPRTVPVPNHKITPQASRRISATGPAITKPCKDKKRENSLLIKQLEAQLQDKLSLVKQLEGENDSLKRKARLLQLSVDTTEHNMNRLADHQLQPTLRSILMSFKSAFNRASADRVMSRMAQVNDPKEMTIEAFSSCWQALVMEMCDALMAESSASPGSPAHQESLAYLDKMCDQCLDFIMTMCVHHCQIVKIAQSINLITGEELQDDMLLWQGIANKLALSEEQVKDMVAASEMFNTCITRLGNERHGLKLELDAAMSQEINFESCSISPVHEIMERMNSNLMRCHTMITLFCFSILRIMTPKQTAQLAMESMPLFPNLKLFAWGITEQYTRQQAQAAAQQQQEQQRQQNAKPARKPAGRKPRN